MTPSEICELLRRRLPEAVVGFEAEAAQPTILVEPMQLHAVGQLLRDDPALDFDRLLLVSGIDWEGYDDTGKGRHRKIAQYAEDGTVEPVTEPGTGDLGVAYHRQSRRPLHSIVLKVRLPREEPKVQSLSDLYPTAAWSERETFDFFGIDFVGNPDLRRLFLPEDWVGHPLLKDYEMPASYHDVPLEGLPLAVREQRSGPTGGGES